MLTYPKIDPICLRIFGFELYWYSIAYITGIVTGLWFAKLYQRHYWPTLPNDLFDRLGSYIIIGILLGGRVGYVFLYAFHEFWINPWYLVEFPIRGMSFHGGFIGVVIATLLFARRNKISFFLISDILSCAVPIGLFLGRMANFINGELYGRVTDWWCGMIFPGGGILPRHPSQIYEAILEGFVLFIIMNALYNIKKIREKRGALSGLFMIFYGSFRFIVEYAREPTDGYAIIGSLWLTWGQVYSLPMILFGVILLALTTLFIPAKSK